MSVISKLAMLGSSGLTGGIEYVGGTTATSSTSTSNLVVPLTSLTGGLASSPAEGDIVVVYHGNGTFDQQNLSLSGYTTIASLYVNDSRRTNLFVGYKIMGATPDTSLTLLSVNSEVPRAAAIQVWRGVDTTTPLDVLSATSTAINTVRCNPPSITPATSKALIVSGGAGAHSAGSALVFSSSDLDGFLTAGVYNNENDVGSTVGLGYRNKVTGSFDPAQFGISGSDSASNSCASVTIALRPQ